MIFTIRTIGCGEVSKNELQQKLTVNGWASTVRDHGGIIFIDLRDRTGIIQLVIDPSVNEQVHNEAEAIRSEWVLSATGTLRERGTDRINPNIKTGYIELVVETLEILNKAKTPPFELDADDLSEELRLKYRYMDLRRPEMFANMLIRHKITQAIREFLDGRGFLEVETPILNRSTPEGARDFLVPSRLNQGLFYALPQSPQIFKQILMVSGFDRYFQIARCFRDEDLRADRQPEFTQVDIEMAFIKRETLMNEMEDLFKFMFKKVLAIDLETPFQRMSYKEAMENYGSDKPDVRFDLKITNVTEVVKDSEFKVFSDTINRKGIICGLCVKNAAGVSRKDIEDYTAIIAKQFNAKGLAWMRVKDGKLESSIVKFFSESIQQGLIQRFNAENDDLFLFVADNPKIVYGSLGLLRLKLADKLGLIKDRRKLHFSWVIDFPLFDYNEDTKHYDSVNHPFTAPLLPEGSNFESINPDTTISESYDLIINGVEAGGGSIRIHDMVLQKRIFKYLGISDEEAEERYSFLMQALEYGAPPHGGIAFGLDRLIMLIQGCSSIRDVMPFPKTQKGTCLLSNAPSDVPADQLLELGVRVVKPEVKKG